MTSLKKYLNYLAILEKSNIKLNNHQNDKNKEHDKEAKSKARC